MHGASSNISRRTARVLTLTLLSAACRPEPAGPLSADARTRTEARVDNCFPNCGGYAVTALLPSGLVGEALSINDIGGMAGWTSGSGGYRAFYTPSAAVPVTLLPMLPWAVACIAYDVNHFGTVVGVCTTPSSYAQAFRWNARSGIKALTMPNGYVSSSAYSINDSGRIAGKVEDSADHDHAIVWDASGAPLQMTDASSGSAEVHVIDNAGNMAGVATYSGPGFTDTMVTEWAGTPLQTGGISVGVEAQGGFDVDAAWPSSGGSIIVHYNKGCVTQLGCVTLPLLASGVSENGKIVGRVEATARGVTSSSASYMLSVLGQAHALPAYGSGDSRALAVNACGTIAGSAALTPKGVPTPVVWKKSNCD